VEGNGARTDRRRAARVTLVVDASAALSWSIADESDVEALALLRKVRSEGAIVPALWLFEMENGLRNALRRGRITEAEAQVIQAKLSRLPIRVVDSSERISFHGALALANRFDLSVYDAAYLDVALRYKGDLATRDRRLAEVAGQLGLARKPVKRRR
jgi:predicted nucleic acid-binding protein